jgi:hypothetical protein
MAVPSRFEVAQKEVGLMAVPSRFEVAQKEVGAVASGNSLKWHRRKWV